jgi:hypothetical protein
MVNQLSFHERHQCPLSIRPKFFSRCRPQLQERAVSFLSAGCTHQGRSLLLWLRNPRKLASVGRLINQSIFMTHVRTDANTVNPCQDKSSHLAICGRQRNTPIAFHWDLISQLRWLFGSDGRRFGGQEHVEAACHGMAHIESALLIGHRCCHHHRPRRRL